MDVVRASTAAMAVNESAAVANETNETNGAHDDTVAETAKTPMDRFREVVDANPLDFNSWVQLLALVEAEPTIAQETVESTFDRFLTEFPLCFGYWNKYAQYEYALSKQVAADGTPVVTPEIAAKKAREVYERGVVAVRYSVDMWVKYCEFLIQTLQVPVDEARAALENAVAACGSDPMAGPLWDSYIALETVNNDMLRLNQVFKRIMYHPLSNVEEFWEKYNQFVLAQQLHVLATTEELNALAGEEELMDEGLLRVKVVNSVEAVKNKTVEGMYRRQTFEAGIDRSYFHVTPVTDAALKNWHNYLDYEEVAGDDARCEVLYERCLIACANYEEFWVRYANWKEKVKGFDAANEVLSRAVTIFLKYRGSIYLEYATFLETHGKLELAESTYMKLLNEVAPTLAEAFIRYCNFERRRGGLEAAKTWYQRGVDAFTAQPDVLAYVATSYATFVHKHLSDVEQARSVFENALKTTSAFPLWLNYIHFETSIGGEGFVERVERIYQNAVAESSELSNEEKSDLWFQYAEFMESFSTKIADVRAVLESEITWKRKNGVPRERSLKLLTLESNASRSGYSGYESVATTGVKRARYDTPAAVSAPVQAAAVAAPTSAAYTQYYQAYQGYGAQTYTQADTTATATATPAAYGQAYTQAQYAAYYQQQAQR
uniref:Suppressor of forked domain-containing protein n=1 Tax=Globisporangium ultimum (strain ATCC 200006 / CBS 805.95 / DAOM BR144) TaxID=431595 RepID=K3WYT0_GLOUD